MQNNPKSSLRKVKSQITSFTKLKPKFVLGLTFLFYLPQIIAQTDQPFIDSNLVFEEENGLLVVEAEQFYKQTKGKVRAWHRHSFEDQPKIWSDADGTHIAGASSNAYIEILPDTRTTHDDEIINQLNFSNIPGELAIVHYQVYFNKPGRYYVWVRAYSTGSEDNGIHVGIDGKWPESGQRMQWCNGKNTWTWESKQRTKEKHCGVPHQIYLDIEDAGLHQIMFSMREDGFEFDQFLLTSDRDFKPNSDNTPKTSTIKSGIIPPPFPIVEKDSVEEPDIFNTILSFKNGVKLMRAIHFPKINSPVYQDKQWLAINPNKAKKATVTNAFPFGTGVYDVIFLGVGENDGQSTYVMEVKEKKVGTYKAPLSKYSFEEGPSFCQLWENIDLQKGDEITVRTEVGTLDGEYSRARWGGITFVPKSRGKALIEHLKSFSSN